jgi:hypothetical protein
MMIIVYLFFIYVTAYLLYVFFKGLPSDEVLTPLDKVIFSIMFGLMLFSIFCFASESLKILSLFGKK